VTTPPGPPPPPYGTPPTPYGEQPPNPYPQPPAAPYPPPPPPPYSAESPDFYPSPQQKKSNVWAILALVFGLLGGVLISVVCGIVGLKKAKEGQGDRGLAIAGLVLSALWVGVAVIAVIFFVVLDKGTVTATDVKVGDCLSEIPGDTRVMTVQTIGCEEPHAGEVFAVLQMPDGDFPGQPAIDEYADRCSPELASYSPASMEDDSVQMYVLYPTAETWAQGDRAVTCIATLDPPRTGSIKG
jgi:Septum formation